MNLSLPADRRRARGSNVFITKESEMKRKICFSILPVFSLCILSLIGCPAPEPGASSPIYVAGSYFNSEYANQIGCVWNGGGRTDLTGDSYVGDTEAYGVFFLDGKVFTAGSYQVGRENQDHYPLACYWEDSKKIDLAVDKNVASFAESIFVVGGNVYTAGSYGDGSLTVACYWKNNNERHDLPGNSAAASSIFVTADSTVYTAGYYNDGSKNIACFWINDTYRQDLPGDGTHCAYTTSIYITALGTVFTAGFYNNGSMDVACYWDGSYVKHDLPGDKARASSIIVSGTSLYTAGYYYDGSKTVACYWKNDNERHDLPGDGKHIASAHSIYVSALGTVFTAGDYDDGSKLVACLWINDSKRDLPSDANYDGYANSITVASDGAIYTAGYCTNERRWKACYWKDIERIDLHGNLVRASNLKFVRVFGGVVYAAGNYFDGAKTVPAYWAAGARCDLPSLSGLPADGVYDAYANSICCSSKGGIYTCGSCNDGLKDVACWWNGNDRPTKIDDSAAYSLANSIFWHEGVVYQVGYYNNGSKDIACLWIGCTKFDVFSGTGNSYATSLFVSGSTIYIAGSYENGSQAVPCYWCYSTAGVSKGEHELPADGYPYARANSVYVTTDGTVYTTGYYGSMKTKVACYWKNVNERHDLPGNWAEANSIYVTSDSTVYTAGSNSNGSKNIACYWINDRDRHDLPGDGAHGSYAYSIFVKE
jgi:hypothetical protein